MKMSIDKIGLTLYDFLGYLLPGYTLILVCSLIESSFLDSDLFALSNINDNVFIFSIIAYFLGHISHGIGSAIKDRFYKQFSDRDKRLSRNVFERVRQAAQEVYDINMDSEMKLNTLETYLLADSYIIAAGGSTERDILMAREGFHKASMVAFGFLCLAISVSLFRGGMKIQIRPKEFINLSCGLTAVLSLITLCAVLLFRKAFIFYNRIKINNTFLVFLALVQK